MRWSIIAANRRCKKRYAKCEASGAGRIDRRLYCRDVRYTGRQGVCEPLLTIASIKAMVGKDTRKGIAYDCDKSRLEKIQAERCDESRSGRNKYCRGTEGRSLLWHRVIWIYGVCLV